MRILLIEDNPGDTRFIREMLSEANGGTVELECEETLASGLERLGTGQFDMLLLDLNLPDSQGLETLKRARPFEQTVPVVVLTGLEDEETARKSLESGAQDYLVKGKITADSLRRTIRYAIDRYSIEEAQLRKSEEHYRLLYDNAGEAIFSYDSELMLTDANRVSCKAIGYSREELLGKNILEMGILHSDDIENASNAIGRLFDGEDIIEDEYTFVRKDGTERLFTVTGAATRDPDGDLQSITNICRDVTEERRVEEALRESEALYRTIFNSTGTTLVIAEEDTTLAVVNDEAKNLLGLPRSEIEGRSWTEFVHPDDIEWMKGYNRRRIDEPDDVPSSYETRFVDGYGNVKHVVMKVAMIPGTRRRVASIMDVTERRKAEEEIQRLDHRLMEESEDVRAGIAADLHDDVGQSLMAIKLAFDMQRKKMAGYTDDETGERMAAISEMLAETIDKVRNITVKLVPVELTDSGLGRALRSHLEEFARDTGATCAFKTEGARVQVGVEVKTALFRIAQEALTNVRKHSKSSNVEVSISWSESFVSLCVRDDGAGFDVDGTYAAGRAGEHFGLVAMRERARMLNGEFLVESEPGAGTTVTVSVPLERG